MTRTTATGRLRHAWARLSMRGLGAANRTESRAVMAANNFYILTAVANLPWAIAIMAHNGWSYVLPGVTHLAMISVWMIGLYVSKRGYSPWMSAASIAVAIAQFVFLADVFSRASGFPLALFGMPALAFAMFVPRHFPVRLAIVGATAIVGLWVYLAPTFDAPAVEVAERWLMWAGGLMVASVLCLLVAQSAFADFYFNRERKHNSALLAEARIASQTDALTHLLNRRGAAPYLAAAAADGNYCVAIGDLDRFKRVNDALGHGAGDAVLAAAAATLENSVGAAGSVARWGGEEFLIVMPGLDLAAAEALMETARRDIETKFHDEGVTVTISIGVACAPRYAASDAVLRRTDALLYEAKASGRNLVVGGMLE